MPSLPGNAFFRFGITFFYHVNVAVRVHHALHGKQGSNACIAKAPPKHLFLRMFYGLINMMRVQRLSDTPSYKSAVFTSDVEVILIRKKNLFPFFNCPGFMLFGPSKSFSFHFFGQKLFFKWTHCSSTTFKKTFTYSA